MFATPLAVNFKAFGLEVKQIDPTLLTVALIGVICIVVPFDLTQLLLMLGGAIFYAFSQGVARPRANLKKIEKSVEGPRMKVCPTFPLKQSCSIRRTQERGPPVPPTRRAADKLEEKLTKNISVKLQPSSMPVTAPQFQASTFDGQVDELMSQIVCTPQSDQTVTKLALHVKTVLQSLIPEVEVTGFVTGDLTRGTAFGVAVPEVDIVANASPEVLVARLQGRLTRGGLTEGRASLASQLDGRKLQKSAIRACTDLLVSSGGFKFRRSAFRGEEPKVTLLAPAWFSEQAAFPLDFSVNCVMPLYNAALLTECGKIEPRAKALMLFVRRWAKDRGICHAAKGHLPPYAWSLLVIYFLQVGRSTRILPPVESFAVSKKLLHGQTTLPTTRQQASPEPSVDDDAESVASLFANFVRFYASEVNWRKEAIGTRSGLRQPPNHNMDIHIIMREDGRTDVAPVIEDPFNSGKNVSVGMTECGMDRLQEELSRAVELCNGGCTLSDLLEPWKPVIDTQTTRRKGADGGDDEDSMN